MKSMFGKNMHLKAGVENKGAIDDITAIVVIFNTKIDKTFLLNNLNTTA